MESRNRRPRANSSTLMPPPLRGTRSNGSPAELEIRVTPWTSSPEPHGAPQMTAAIDRIDSQLRIMSDGLAAAAQVETERAARLRQLCDHLHGRNRDLQSLIARVERARYVRMIGRLHRVIDRHVPAGAVVAIVSRGDAQLVSVPGHRGWHFPRTKSGVYLGHHPADSDAALAHLEEVRARGARHLVIPRTAYWWFDHYHGLDAYLQRAATCLFRDTHTCALFTLPARRVGR